MNTVDAVVGLGPFSWILNTLYTALDLTAPVVFGLNIGETYEDETYIDIAELDPNLNASNVYMVEAIQKNYWASMVYGFRFGEPDDKMDFGVEVAYEAIIDSSYSRIEIPYVLGERFMRYLLEDLKEKTAKLDNDYEIINPTNYQLRVNCTTAQEKLKDVYLLFGNYWFQISAKDYLIDVSKRGVGFYEDCELAFRT